MKRFLSTMLLLSMLFISTMAYADVITLVAGKGVNLSEVGLNGADIDLKEVYSSKADKNGNVYIANYNKDSLAPWVVRVDKWGKVDRLYENTTLSKDWFDDISIDSAGNVFIPAVDSNVLYKIDLKGDTSIYAGNGSFGYSGDDGPATSAQLENPESVAIDQEGNLYVAHSNSPNPVIRKIDKSGTITTIFDGSPLGIVAPDSLYVDNCNCLYFSASNKKVYRLSQGTATEIATALGAVHGIAGDDSGNLFYAYKYFDSVAGAMRTLVKKIDAFGVETTVYDNTTRQDYIARLSTDSDGMLYITFYDHSNSSSVEKVTFSPSIDGVLPLDASIGETVVISGNYFKTNGVGGSVSFGGIAAPIRSWGNGKIVCEIPAGASKTVNVVVTTNDMQTSNPVSYRVR